MESLGAREETSLVVKNAVRLMIRRVQSVQRAREIVTLTRVVLEILCVGEITAETIIAVLTQEMTAAPNQVRNSALKTFIAFEL